MSECDDDDDNDGNDDKVLFVDIAASGQCK